MLQGKRTYAEIQFYICGLTTYKAILKICYIITALDYGGAEKLLVNCANRLIDRFEITIIYLKGNNKLADQLDSKIALQHIPLNVRTIGRIRRYFIEQKPDIIHTHLGHADLLGLYAARGLLAKKFCTMHNIWFKFGRIDYFFFLLYRTVLNRLCRDCTVICISEAVRDHVSKTLKVQNSRSILMYNAIPDIGPKFIKADVRKELGITHDSLLIIFVGRLEKQKSVDTLILAVNYFCGKWPGSEINLAIVGEGSLERSLKRLTRKLNLDRVVTFHGVVPTPEKFFDASDVFVLPSVFEGLGIVIIEAFRAALPVVASNIEGPAELIDHNRNGLLFEPGNWKELGELIGLLSDPAMRRRLGANGRKTFEGSFDLHAYVGKLIQIYAH